MTGRGKTHLALWVARFFGAAGALLILAVVVAGCGGSSDAQGAPLPKPVFVKQANAICQRATEARKQASKEATSKAAEVDESEEAQVFTEALLASVKTMTEELGELGPPKHQEKQVEGIIVAFEGGIEEIEANPESSQVPFAFAEANKLAAAYGLTECSI